METSKTSSSRNLQEIMRQYPLFSYFFMAYTFSWIILIPYILAQWKIISGDYTIFFTLNAFAGPMLSAYIMNYITGGRAEVLRARRSLVQWRAGWQWYLFILIGIPALIMVGVSVLPGALASFSGLPSSFLKTYPINFIIIFLFGGPLGEEPGWRGFALPRMQARFGALRGTLLLGVLWVIWHLPHFLTAAQRGGPDAGLSVFYINLPIFFLMVMSVNIIFAWVYNHTGGSVFIAMLLHASLNAFGTYVLPLFPAPIVTSTELSMLIGFGVAALLILFATRGQLGYQSNREINL